MIIKQRIAANQVSSMDLVVREHTRKHKQYACDPPLALVVHLRTCLLGVPRRQAWFPSPLGRWPSVYMHVCCACRPYAMQGSVEGCDVIVVDDMIDTAGTLTKVTNVVTPAPNTHTIDL